MRYPIFYKTNQEQSDFDVVNEKYNNQKEAFTNFYKMKYRYMANFDISENDPFKIVSEVSNEILNALKRLERENMKELNRQPITSEKMTMLKEKMGQLEKVVWEDDENDEINNKINKAVFICENICKSANKLGF
jgi:hypothetical protein